MSGEQSFVENIAQCAIDGRLDAEAAQRQLIKIINDTIADANQEPNSRLAEITEIRVVGDRLYIEGLAERMERRRVAAGS